MQQGRASQEIQYYIEAGGLVAFNFISSRVQVSFEAITCAADYRTALSTG